MTLPAPNLDDRGFQDLVDEAKRLVQLRNPNWTDHNVSDPGVTLIETFAYMADQLIYRLNRVPDRHYVKFLELLGEQLIPPGAATTELEFRLSVAQELDVVIPEGTLVSTPRTTPAPPITFTTQQDLLIPTLAVREVLTKSVDGPFESHDEARALERDFPAFSEMPRPDDALYLALSALAHDCIVRLSFVGAPTIEGIGVDPRNPPYVVESWNGQEWHPVDLLADDTGGLNRDGDIEFFLRDHVLSTIAGIEGAWLRIRVVEAAPGQPRYRVTPTIGTVTASAVGGVVRAQHCEPVLGELLGPCSGTPGDRLTLSRSPLTGGQLYMTIEVSGAHGWETWERVESFADSGPTDRHFTVDMVSGEIRFGPVVRQPDGSARLYGATPPAQSMVRVPRYLVGGGRQGNVEASTLTVLRSSIPFVTSVTNPRAANGGSDAETVDDLKERAAITVRTQTRAVSAQDYEMLVRLAAPSIARVACRDASETGRPGHVLVQVIPTVPADLRDFSLLQPPAEVLDEIRDLLEPRRVLGSIVHIEPPSYLGVVVATRIIAQPGADARTVSARADAALRAFLHPVTGGPRGDGWPFGHPLVIGEVHSVLQQVPGVAYVDLVRLIPADVVTGARGIPGDIVQPDPRSLLFCVGNEIEVRE